MNKAALQFAPQPEMPAEMVEVALLMKTLQLVDAPPEEAFDKFTRLAATCLPVPVALVSIVEEDKDRQYFKSQLGLQGHWAEDRQTPLSHSFCQYVKRDNRPLVIEDAPNDARVCGNQAIPDLGVGAYLGVPIHGPMGEPLGALCAIDTQPRAWTPEDLQIMMDIGASVSDQIGLRAALLRAHQL